MNTFEETKHAEGMSIIAPFLNEREGIAAFCNALDANAKEMPFETELIFVDDGSTDDTCDIIRQYTFRHIKRVALISLSKNFGSHAAIRAGLCYASFDVCTWMGSDLQEPIEFLKLSYDKISEGYDAVYIEKKSICVSKANRSFSRLYSFLMRRYAVKNYSSGGISNIVFNHKVRTFLNRNVESNSSIMLQIMDAGFKNTTISLHYNERFAGVSKWTLAKKIKLFIDSFVAFSFAPIRFVSLIGIAMFLIGILIGGITLVNKVISPAVPIGYSTLASIMALGFGITNISLGILAEYLWRAYDAARNRPAFIVSEVTNIINKDIAASGKEEHI